MSDTQRSVEYEQLMDANSRLKEAERLYHEKIRQFVSSAPPKRALDEKGMKEIDDAEAVKDQAGEAFKKALDAYYIAKA